ncbi:hypothetical protein NM688_g4467 [Phlebia brevispora]|uniref:Uncharacterized protein n=1 Tax=Phlebia brevispora TaxID=194682 RepID=A0ACC1T315_9APHY|nr:hypothetical protein NM688_g4467 [Phlebia brevispora]
MTPGNNETSSRDVYSAESKENFSEDCTTTCSHDGSTASRGVERILFPTNTIMNDQKMDAIIKDAARELARQGKRVSLAPKRMYVVADGIAIDWIRDFSVQDQSTERLLHEMPNAVFKDALISVLPVHHDGSDRHAREPIHIDAGHLARSNSAQHDAIDTHRARYDRSTPAHSICDASMADECYRRDAKRKSTSPDNFLTLRNLSHKMDESALRLFLTENGIPQSAISGIRLRAMGNSVTATIDLVEGSTFPHLHHRSWTIRATPQLSRNSTPAANSGSSTPSRLDTPASAQDRSFSRPVKDEDAEREIIDLVSDDSDIELIEPYLPERQEIAVTRSEDTDEVASPALSYLTVDDARDNGAEVLPQLAADHVADNHSRTSSFLDESDSSSDDESLGADSNRDQHDPPAFAPPRATSEEVFAHRLLHGPIDAVHEYLTHESRSRYVPTSTADRLAPERTANALHDNDRPNGRLVTRRNPAGTTDTHAGTAGGLIRKRVGLDNRQPISAEPADGPDIPGVTITVPKTSYAKGRRLLVPSDTTLPITTVYMRGDLEFINQTRRYDDIPRYVYRTLRLHSVRHSRFSLPFEDEDANPRHVVDAHLLNNNMIVVGYNEGYTQVSCVTLMEGRRPMRCDLSHRAHNVVHEHRRVGRSTPNRGISCMCVSNEQPSQFLSGGEDGSVHSWTVSHAAGELSAKSVKLGIQHAQPIHCISCRTSDRRLFTCYSQYIHSADFEATYKPSDAVFLSCKPQQIHIHPQNPSIVILEVSLRMRSPIRAGWLTGENACRSIIVIDKYKYTTRGGVISEQRLASSLATKRQGQMSRREERIATSRDQPSTPFSPGAINVAWHVFGIIANRRCVAAAWI